MESYNNQVLVVCLNPTLQETMVFDRVLMGEVNRALFHRLDASGKGMNVTRVLTQLGSRCSLLSHLGGSRAQEFLALADKDGVNIIWTDSDSPIRTCITMIQQADASTTELVQEAVAVHAKTEANIRLLYTKHLQEVEAVVFSGTRAPGYSKELYAQMVKEAKDAGKFVVLDYRGEDLKRSLGMRADVIKPNLSEFCATFFSADQMITEQQDPEHLKQQVALAMKELYETYQTMTIITHGGKDLWAYDGKKWYEMPAKKVKVQNTIGCGDAFTAGFVHAHVQKKSFSEALELATDTAASNAACLAPGSIYDDSPNTFAK